MDDKLFFFPPRSRRCEALDSIERTREKMEERMRTLSFSPLFLFPSLFDE